MKTTITKPSYDEQLRSPRWQRRRLEILNRAGFKCECCEESEKELQVHHLDYLDCRPEEHPDQYLEVLCRNCHEWREHWNAVFGRSLVSTIFLKRIRESGLGLLVSRPRNSGDFVTDSLCSDMLISFLRTVLIDTNIESPDAIYERHFRVAQEKRKQAAALRENRYGARFDAMPDEQWQEIFAKHYPELDHSKMKGEAIREVMLFAIQSEVTGQPNPARR